MLASSREMTVNEGRESWRTTCSKGPWSCTNQGHCGSCFNPSATRGHVHLFIISIAGFLWFLHIFLLFFHHVSLLCLSLRFINLRVTSCAQFVSIASPLGAKQWSRITVSPISFYQATLLKLFRLSAATLSQFYTSILLALHIDLLLIFPAGVAAPSGSKVAEAIKRPAGPRHQHTLTHKCRGGRLSDSLISQCEKTKPLRCTAVNRIRRPLVLLPSPLPLYAYFSCKCCNMCVFTCVCSTERSILLQRWRLIAYPHTWRGRGNDSADKVEPRERRRRGLLLVARGINLACWG